MSKYILPNESRADIATAIKDQLMGGAARHIAPRLFPIVKTGQRAGSWYLATFAGPSVTSGRSYGNTLSGTHKANSSKSWETARQESRVCLEDADIEDMGGIDPAVLASAEEGLRAIGVKLDNLAYLAVKTAASTPAEISPVAPFAAIADAAVKVKRYGEPYLVCGESWLNQFVKNTTVQLTLRGLYGDRIFLDITTGVESVLSAVGVAFGVKGIIVGDDAAFTYLANSADATSGVVDKTNAFVVALRDMGANPLVTAKVQPVFGLMPVFIPGDDAEVQVETSYDAGGKVNNVDATVWAAALTVNAGAAKAVAIPATGWVTGLPVDTNPAAESSSSSSSAASSDSSSSS